MLKILYRDKHIVAVIKPCGLLSEPSPTEDSSVLSELSAQDNIPDVFPIHRLDRNVSGLLLVAKNKASAGKFSALVQEHTMNKEYLAIVHGRPAEDFGIYKDLLFKDSSCNKSFVTDKLRRGVKEASLEYRVIGTADSEDGTLSLVRVRLHTGRTHQIRVQFSSRKTPLFGDGKYGSHTNRGEIALFSARMSFVHPFTGKDTDIREVPDGQSYPWSLFAQHLSAKLFDEKILDQQ